MSECCGKLLKAIIYDLHTLVHGRAKDGFILCDCDGEPYSPKDGLKLEFNKGEVSAILECIKRIEDNFKK